MINKDLLRLDNMITPKIITGVYWLFLAVAVIKGLEKMFGTGFSFGNFLTGLVTIALYAVSARIVSELLIVLFKMNEALQDMRNK